MVCFLVGTESRTTLSFSTLVFVFFCSFFFFFFFFFFTCVHSSILSGSHVETFQVSSYRCELNKKKKKEKKRKKREKKMWSEKMSEIFACFTKTPGADAGRGSSWFQNPRLLTLSFQRGSLTDQRSVQTHRLVASLMLS